MKNNLDISTLKKQVGNFFKAESKHSAFLAIMLVLMTYLFLVWQISKLAIAEPSSDETAIAQTNIPKIDKRAINQIQSLEQNNTDIRSLFDNARNNPFQE
jgi:apolipoprotein N-acyltransferase